MRRLRPLAAALPLMAAGCVWPGSDTPTLDVEVGPPPSGTAAHVTLTTAGGTRVFRARGRDPKSDVASFSTDEAGRYVLEVSVAESSPSDAQVTGCITRFAWSGDHSATVRVDLAGRCSFTTDGVTDDRPS